MVPDLFAVEGGQKLINILIAWVSKKKNNYTRRHFTYSPGLIINNWFRRFQYLSWKRNVYLLSRNTSVKLYKATQDSRIC